MSDKDHGKSALLFESLRRSLSLRPGETRPLSLGSSLKQTLPVARREYFDATAKRDFSVQVPKRMLTYTVCIFFVAPLVLFGYFEVHTRTIHHHYAQEHDVKVREHFSKDILTLLTDEEEEEENVVNRTDINEAGNANTTSVVVRATTNSTMKTRKVKDTMKHDTADADKADQTKIDEKSKEQRVNRLVTNEKADSQNGKKRVLRQR